MGFYIDDGDCQEEIIFYFFVFCFYRNFITYLGHDKTHVHLLITLSIDVLRVCNKYDGYYKSFFARKINDLKQKK